MKLKVVGVLAYDSIISEYGEKDNLFGGSATHFAISSSYLNKSVHITGGIGHDFKNDDLKTLISKGINTEGIEKLDQSTFRWEGKYENDSPNDAITISNSIIKGEDNVIVVPLIEVTVVPDAKPEPTTKSPTSTSVASFITIV